MLTFAAVYGRETVYNPRPAWGGFHMLRRGDDSIRDSAVAGYVTITGGAPLICLRANLTDQARDLVTAAGLPWLDQALTYTNAEDYRAILDTCRARALNVVFQHAHPSDPALDPLYWIPRDVLIRLNDKANLTRFVPEEHCPPRRILSVAAAAALPFIPGTTMVFKGSTEMSTGSGGAVVIARAETEVRTLAQRLGGCDRIIVEEYQPFTRTMCLNWAADHAGAVHFIGSADQVVGADGSYLSSWIGPDFPAPESAVALGGEILRHAADLGYVGYAGFDVGILPDGRPLVFDLNFRICSSTMALLWYPELRRRFGPDCHARVLSASAPISFDEICRIGRKLSEDGTIVPFGAFDPSRSIWADRAPSLRGVVVGRNRAETEARCEAILAHGLTFR